MTNQIIVVGRIVSDLKINETENGKKSCKVVISVPRSYKNDDGIYETDFIEVMLYSNLANNTTEWCKKGDLIGIRGKIEGKISNGEIDLTLVAEKVTFLSSDPKLIAKTEAERYY